jgi:hypothetical protein
MTGNTTQAVLDAVDLLQGVPPEQAPVLRARLLRMLRGIVSFAAGCAAAAVLYALVGFYGLAVPVVVGAASAIMRPDDRSRAPCGLLPAPSGLGDGRLRRGAPISRPQLSDSTEDHAP